MRCALTWLTLSVLVAAVPHLYAQDPTPPVLTPEEQKLAAEARKLNNESEELFRRDQFPEAAAKLDQALAILRKLYPADTRPGGAPLFAFTLENMGLVLRNQGELAKALTHYEQALAMRRTLYPKSKFPNGHIAIGDSLTAIGLLWKDLGAYEKALLYFDEVVTMARKLFPESDYPNGNRSLAISLSNLGETLYDLRDFDKALPYLEQSLAIFRKLYPESKYPDGHPDLATSLNRLAWALKKEGPPDRALTYFREELAMNRKLFPAAKFPDGASMLARSLRNMGFILFDLGKVDDAIPYLDDVLAMSRKLYPASKFPNNSSIGYSLESLASAHYALGHFETAMRYFREAHDVERPRLRRALLRGSEADALAIVQHNRQIRDVFLSVAAHVPGSSDTAYEQVWETKARATRVLELRHATARAAGTAAGDVTARLRENHRRTDQLLQDYRLNPADRDKRLADLNDQRDRLERDLVAVLPILDRWKERDQLKPADLAKALPAGSAFIDLLAYVRFDPDPIAKDRSHARFLPSYAAFLLAPGRPAVRIELGDAGPINAAIRSWREVIERGTASPAADQLRALLWEPLAKHLPPGTKTLVFAPDADLTRLPWAALPVGNGRVLLEDVAVATVPHGPFLLDQLTHPLTFQGPESVLALGDVTYASAAWPQLPATLVELNAVRALAPGTCDTLSQSDATAANLVARLPRARFAHLATHGEFQAAAFVAATNRERDARKNWHEGTVQEPRPAAAKTPLGFVGLVMANGEVLSGLSILDLNLENLKLVTLSACETGLGALTGGEGVQGLQRAFHLAGCPNVVASLWKVNDAATAALMAKFYHELWVNKKAPIEALREAQLTIYRHPELIPDLAGERGAPRLKEAVAAKSDPGAATPNGKHADTKLWAAFVLSGVGK